MTHLWPNLVAAVHGAITLIAAATGGNVGLAIVTVSIALRVALLPFSIRMARRAQAQQSVLAKLKPELERLKARYRQQPDRLASETLALYKRHGVRPADPSTILLLLVQLPLVSALYSAISRGLGAGRRFLWIRDLAQPDILLVGLTGILTFVSSAFNSSREVGRAASVVSAALTVAIMWRISAALGLYWASSTAVGAVQSLWLSRHSERS